MTPPSSAETGLKNSQDESHRRLLELEVLYHTAGVALGFLDQDLRYVRLNGALATINGLSIEAHLGQHAKDVNPRLAGIIVPMLAEVIASKRPMLGVELTSNTPTDVMHQDQQTWIVSMHPVNHAEILGVSLMFQDITQQKRAHAALLRSNAELRQFAFAAAHDLQEPLRNISLYAQLLNTAYKPVSGYETTDKGDANEHLSVVIESARRMQTLIKDLLGFTEAVGILGETSDLVDCNEACQTALDNLTSTIQECQADVTVAPLPKVISQHAHLVQLFQNLIGNALKYRSKERQAQIHVSAEKRDEHWVFSIQDNGIGIAPQYHERIFGVFKRLHGPEVPGTGIGLAICKRIVDHHGGRLWLESELGAGSTFRFSFPSKAHPT